MHLGNFSIATITTGSLASALDAAASTGFTQTRLWAKELVGHADGYKTDFAASASADFTCATIAV